MPARGRALGGDARERLVLTAATTLAVTVTATLLASAVAPAVRRASSDELTAAARLTTSGIPVPSPARRCSSQVAAAAGGTRWCLPAGTSAVSVRRWYDDHLPAGRSSNGLRWCMRQVRSDGGRTALWVADGALVGYTLPTTELLPGDRGLLRDARVVMETTRVPGHGCPRVARASRAGQP